MVIAQALGRTGPNRVSVADARAVIRRIESENQAVRAAVLAKVAASRKPTEEEKREEAVAQVMKENRSFELAVIHELIELIV